MWPWAQAPRRRPRPPSRSSTWRARTPASLRHVDPQAGLEPLTGAVGHATGPVAGLKPNPLAGTGVDPLDNGVGTQLADFKPLTRGR